VPFSENDIYFDYQIIFEDKIKGRINVMLAVVKKEIILPYLKIMEGVTGALAGIDISSNAIANFFEIKKKTVPNNFGVVYGSANILEFSGIRKSRLQYSKYINTSAASDDFKEKLSSELISMTDKLVGKDDKGVFKIIFCVKDVSEELIDQLRETVDQNIVRAEDSGNAISDSAMIPAYGLSIKGLQKVSMNMNFLPVSLQRKPGKIGIYSFYILICLMCLALGMWGGGLFFKKRQALNELQTAINNIQQELGQLTAVTIESQKIQKRIDFLKSFPTRDGRLIDIINELSQRIPETAWINSFNYSNGKLRIEGFAKNASELIPLIEASSHFNDVTFLSTIRKDNSGQENFTIGLDVDASSSP
ncbi:MAG: PilN domain-containing protein, partial [Desulfobacteraceae bacterium]|nr:PilN domain-containing protein [Desulfobacteraceae bacterium]